jgi:hypothetical protein
MNNFRKILEQKKGELNKLNSSIKDCKSKIKELKKQFIHLDQAREVIKLVGIKTKQDFSSYVLLKPVGSWQIDKNQTIE